MKKGFTIIELMVAIAFMLFATFLFISYDFSIFRKSKLENTILLINSSMRKYQIISKKNIKVNICLDLYNKEIIASYNNKIEIIYLDRSFEYKTNSKVSRKLELYFNENGILNRSFTIIIKNKNNITLKEIAYLNTSSTRGLIIHVK